jgi:hypothetical protein
MYNWKFLAEHYGYGWLTDDLPLDNAEHVTFDPLKGEVKIYLHSECGQFMYKLTPEGQVMRHLYYPHPDFKIDVLGLYQLISPERPLLTLKLYAFDEGGGGFYFWLEDASRRDFVALFEGMAHYTGLSLETLIGYANKINGLNCKTPQELYEARALRMIRLGERQAGCKFYAAPMRWQNPYQLDPVSIQFLKQLYKKLEEPLDERLVNLAVSIEFHTERLLITTQNVANRRV